MSDSSNPSGARRIDGLVAQMSLEEKAAQAASMLASDTPPRTSAGDHAGIGGVAWPVSVLKQPPPLAAKAVNALQRALVEETRLGIPALLSEEGLCGLKVQDTTIFPDAISQAATWDPELVEEMGATVGRHMATVGVRQALSPLCDVARDARWGRIEETYGEDPYLVGCMATAFVRGLQEVGGGNVATLKHFIAYPASEGGRNIYPAHVGTRELHEVYGLPFEMAIRLAGARAVMCSYNQVDGVPVQASQDLLTELLRDEYGFEGILISDLHSVEHLHTLHGVAEDMADAVALSYRAGLDVELAKHPSTDDVLAAVADGRLSESDLDRAVRRHLWVKSEIGLLEDPYVDESVVPDDLDSADDRALARRVAERSLVLLQNEPVDGRPLLPLAPAPRSIALIGPIADRAMAMLGNYTYPVLESAMIRMVDAADPAANLAEAEMAAHDIFNVKRVWADEAVQSVDTVPIVTVLEGVTARAGAGVSVRYARGCPIEEPDTSGIEEAAALAASSDVAIVVVGEQSGLGSAATVGEGVDSVDCALPGVQRQLVEAVAATGTPMIVVLMHGRPLVLDWLVPIAPAVITGWFPGEEGGHAIAAALFGDVNPGGKLPASFPVHVGQLPLPYNRTFDPGSPYYNCSTGTVFPFGHGLSYTSFEYSHLEITPEDPATDGVVEVRCAVTNTGPVAGDEVVQLYLRDPFARTSRPRRELKGFRRVQLQPGQSRTVTFVLPSDRVGLYDTADGWVVEPGRIEVMVGSSSEDIRLRGECTFRGPVRTLDGSRALVTEVRVG